MVALLCDCSHCRGFFLRPRLDALRDANDSTRVLRESRHEGRSCFGSTLLETGERFLGHTVAIVVGFVLMIVGLGMGVTMVLLPIGLPMGLVGTTALMWGLFAAPQAVEDKEDVTEMSVDLRTTYLGLELRNPLVASASPLTGHLDSLCQMEEAGAAAVVMPSLFEEQLRTGRAGRARLFRTRNGSVRQDTPGAARARPVQHWAGKLPRERSSEPRRRSRSR